jgi:acetyltransferase
VSHGLDPLFAPRRVAVLGVSRNPDKLGHRLLQNVLAWDFPGQVWAVNPSGETILGVKCVPAVEALPAEPDLALVSLPAVAVLEAVRALGGLGCRTAVILTSGFGETGAEGRAVQAELAAIGRTSAMRIVGPNCMGVVSVPARLNGSYFWDVPRAAGGVSFLSQSGAYGGLFFREVRARRLGVARFLSLGNQTDVGFTECLEWLAADPETRVVALLVEAVRDGAAFVRAAHRLTRDKPVVALKVGRGAAGRRAAGSHTGSIAGEHATYRAGFAAAGVVVTDDTDEFFDAVAVLAAQGSRLPAGDGLAVLTVSGGPSVAAADAAEAAGLQVPTLPAERRAALRAHLPAFGADGNPVDMTPQMDPAAFGPAVRLVLETPAVAGAVMIDVGLDQPAYGAAVAAAHAATGKPVVACTTDTPEIDRQLAAAGIPVFPTPERAVRAWRALRRHAAGRVRPAAARRPRRLLPAGVAEAVARGPGALPYAVSRALLAAYGVPFATERVVTSEADALSAARQIGYPVVVKTARPDVLHKTEAGGVLLDVGDDHALRAAWAHLAERFGGSDVVVQRRVAAGLELLVGGRRDPVFGPTVAFGLGGVLAEALGEVRLGLAPLSEAEARDLLAGPRTAALLAGVRGAPPCDGGALAAILMGVGDLLLDQPAIAELDVNPLIARGPESVAVDALIIVDQGGTADA